MSGDTQKKKIRHGHYTQTVLYCLFTPVYSGITPALLGTANSSTYDTQIDHKASFQTPHVTKVHYQVFFNVLIDLILELLGLIIKTFDNQTER